MYPIYRLYMYCMYFIHDIAGWCTVLVKALESCTRPLDSGALRTSRRWLRVLGQKSPKNSIKEWFLPLFVGHRQPDPPLESQVLPVGNGVSESTYRSLLSPSIFFQALGLIGSLFFLDPSYRSTAPDLLLVFTLFRLYFV